MGESKHTPGPWVFEDYSQEEPEFFVVPATYFGTVAKTGNEADARLIAAAPEMLEALRLHKAWADSERAGPDYGGQTRDSHPDGERIWRAWWDNQLDLCDRANRATDAAIAKAEGGAS